jgi:hypothetical protein
MQYSDFQNMPSSEKITLAILEASKRLMGWELDSGSVYKLTGFSFAVIASLEDSGTSYTSVGSVGALSAGKFYHDRDNETLYVHATASANPNSRFLVVTVQLFFANVPVVLPYDLMSGSEVLFEPMIDSTSEFGVQIDTINQTSEAIEGSGSLTLDNDQDFWIENYDRLSFENQRCTLYSYHRDLDPYDAHLIFKGRVERKSYSREKVAFQLKDLFSELRASVAQDTIGDLAERTGTDLENAKQRMVLGRVFGNIPTNIDQVLDGYPLTGLVSVTAGSLNVTGSGTEFLSELSPNDRLVLQDKDYSVASITDDTNLVLSQEYAGTANLTNESASFIPDQPKRFINRAFKIAGHALRQPTTQTQGGSTIQALYVDDTTDIYPGDVIYIGTLGSGESAIVDAVYPPFYIRLATSLATVPPVGTSVHRPAVQNVRIDSTKLEYYRDYELDASTAVLTLRSTAEENAGPIYQHVDDMAFTNGSETVTGSGFQAVIQPGYMVGIVGNANFFEVLSVDSDTQLTLRTPANFTDTDSGRYKSLIFNPDNMTISLDVLGRTDDGTPTGNLLKTAPAISKALIQDAGLSAEIDEDSFDEAEEIAYQSIGIVVPENYNDTNSPSYRDVMNAVNKSVFGSVVQNNEFKFAYQVLQPEKPTAAVKFSEADLLSFSLNSVADNAVKTCILEYKRQEHDYISAQESVPTVQQTSDNAQYLVKTEREKTIRGYLVDETEARIMVNRWSFLLSTSTGRLTFTTKLQGATLEVGDIIEIEHRKFFQRYGGSGKRKLLLVESVKRNGSTVRVEATDLSNTFNRVACINGNEAEWADATEDEKLYGGYISDQYGLIDNDPESFETNLIW